MEGISRVLFRNTAYSLSLLFALVTLCFLFFSVAPGDTARIILGPNAPEESVIQLRHELGIDLPLFEQWAKYFTGLFQGELGHSWLDGRDVAQEVFPKFLITAKIGAMAALISFATSYLVNLLIFLRPKASWVKLLINAGVIFPSFYAGVLAVLIIGHFFPGISLVGYGDDIGSWSHLFLPALVIALYPMALLSRLLEEKLMDQGVAVHTRAMRAWGYGKWVLFHKALLRPAAVPWITGWVNQLSIIFIASFIVEVIFTIPGIGTLLLNSIQRKDFPMLQGIIVINGIFFIAMFWLNEIFIRWIDHRVR